MDKIKRSSFFRFQYILRVAKIPLLGNQAPKNLLGLIGLDFYVYETKRLCMLTLKYTIQYQICTIGSLFTLCLSGMKTNLSLEKSEVLSAYNYDKFSELLKKVIKRWFSLQPSEKRSYFSQHILKWKNQYAKWKI